MSARQKLYLQYFVVSLAVAAAMAMTAITWWTYSLNQRVGQDYAELKLDTAQSRQPYNILLMGFDKRPSWENYRSDAMLVLRIDPAKDKIWLISLPRDYQVSVPGVGEVKLGQAFLFGGMRGSVDTVQYLIEMPINYVATVDFKSFVAIVNALGGVEVDVPANINDVEADETKGNRASSIRAGVQLLDGDHALTFVRSRDYPDADFSRMKSQRIFLKSLYARFRDAPLFLQLNAIEKAVPYVKTNMRLNDIVRVVLDFRQIGTDELQLRELPGTWEYPAVVPDIDGLAAVLDEVR